MLSHLRGIIFVGWGALPASSRTIFVLALYTCTAFFHEAVIVFFVLSGFLIAGPNIDRVRLVLFSPKSYGIDRFTRIYVTAVPALFLTLGADAIGRGMLSWTGFYSGLNMLFHERFPGVVAQQSNFRDFLGNLAMLQPIYVPVFGSNFPLWSLSYEVWFYVWFGLVASYVQSTRRFVPLVIALITLSLVLFHWTALYYLAIWCFGALAYQWSRWPNSIKLALVCFLASLGFAEYIGSPLNIPGKPSDIFVGFSFAWLLALMKRRSYKILDRTHKLNDLFSSFSYSLYVTHYPVLLCLVGFFAELAGLSRKLKQGLVPGATGLAVYFATAVSMLLIAFVFSRLFEARTGQVRRRLKNML